MSRISDCQTCAYRQYVNREQSMCAHKHRQTRLATTGLVEMKKKEFIKLCPEHSLSRDPHQVGITSPDKLRSSFGAIEKLEKPLPKPVEQTSLF